MSLRRVRVTWLARDDGPYMAECCVGHFEKDGCQKWVRAWAPTPRQAVEAVLDHPMAADVRPLFWHQLGPSGAPRDLYRVGGPHA